RRGRRWGRGGKPGGGLAALAVGELESDIRDPDYLGSIAISGIADAKEFYETSATDSLPTPLVVVAYQIQSVYPQFQANQMLTEKGLAFYSQLEKSCVVMSRDPDTIAAPVLKPGWQEHRVVEPVLAPHTLAREAHSP